MRKTASALPALALALALAAGCAAQGPSILPTPAPTPMATPLPTPTPEPTPEPFDPEAAAERFEELWQEELDIVIEHWVQSLELNLAPYEEGGLFHPESPWNIQGSDEDERVWLPQIEEVLAILLPRALDLAAEAFKEEFAAFSPAVETSASWPGWQYIYALIRGCGSGEAAQTLMKRALELTVSPLPGGEAGLEVSISPLHYKEAMKLPGGDEPAYMGRCFAYSYCMTVYGEDAREQEYVQPPAEGSLAEGIVWPLESHTRLRKTWYADRNDGSRKHTGTDIWADADTEIYSCTDGVVTFVGYSDGMGNAVIVTDPYGYEFHYYHMIRLPDFISRGQRVSAGELIGHVGNTGNSSLDHLHLTIAAPDGTYVNPYPYLEAAEP